MNNIIGIIGSGGDGGTFLDWTLYYLANQTYIYGTYIGPLQRKIDAKFPFMKIPLVNNPLMSRKIKDNKPVTTAHKHLKTHPTQFSIGECIDSYKKVNDPDLSILSFYCVQAGTNDWIPLESFALKCSTLYPEIKFIVLCSSNETYTDLHNRAVVTDTTNRNIDDLLKYTKSTITTLHNTNNRYMLDVRDMYNNLDTKIFEIFEWANRKVSTERYDNWKSIYFQWRDSLPKVNCQ